VITAGVDQRGAWQQQQGPAENDGQAKGGRTVGCDHAVGAIVEDRAAVQPVRLVEEDHVDIGFSRQLPADLSHEPVLGFGVAEIPERPCHVVVLPAYLAFTTVQKHFRVFWVVEGSSSDRPVVFCHLHMAVDEGALRLVGRVGRRELAEGRKA
jgi:hypothetical protein